MSRPDDVLAPNAGHPAGWPPRSQDVARDPVTGRPLAPMPAHGDWQQAQPHAAPGYHYPAQDQGQFYVPAGGHGAPGPQQHYQPPSAPPRQQAAPGDYSPQFARYSGATDVQPPLPQAFNADAYAPPGQANPNVGHAVQGNQGWQPAGYPGPAQGHEPAQGYYPPSQGYADPNAGYQQGYPGNAGAYPDNAYAQYPAGEQPYDPRAAQGYGDGHGQGAALDARQPIAGADAEYDADYGYDAPPKKRRGLLVAGALVCAVAVGGGLAFVYKTFGQGGKRIGPPPVVAKASTPAKVAPSDPQGKQFDNANRKVLARLEEPTAGSTQPASAGPAPMVPGMIVSMPSSPAPAQPPAAAESSGGPSTRTVQTVQIGRDGNPVGAQQQPVSPRGLPGVQIDNSLNPPAMRGGLADGGQQQAAVAPPAKPAPQRLAAAPAEPAPANTAPDAGDAPAPKPRPKATLPKVAKAPAATGSTGAVPAASGGGGYVAVLSSQKDRAAALRIFADLAQKYPDQLGSRQPEVQEANLGEKGVWQRLVVGPPGSQQSAKELCTQLKAAGHSGDCWAKQY